MRVENLVNMDSPYPALRPAGVRHRRIWMTVAQLANFVRYGNHVNVSARSLLTSLARYGGVT